MPCHNNYYYILKQQMIVFEQATCPIVILNRTHNQSIPTPDEDLMKTPDEDLINPCWTGLLSGWVTFWIISLCCTPWEVRPAQWTSIMPSTSTTNVVCVLSFSGSQPEGFFQVLQFPPSSKSTSIVQGQKFISSLSDYCHMLPYSNKVYQTRSKNSQTWQSTILL